MMPHVDGFEACRAIKQNPSTRLIPVGLVTSLNDTVSRIRGIEAGADDFVSKPFNVHELRARVRSLLLIKRYTDDLDSAASVIVSLALTIALDLLITDLRMPEMEGDELARQVRALEPDLKVVYLTSHADRLFDAKPQLWAERGLSGQAVYARGTSRSDRAAARRPHDALKGAER